MSESKKSAEWWPTPDANNHQDGNSNRRGEPMLIPALCILVSFVCGVAAYVMQEESDAKVR